MKRTISKDVAVAGAAGEALAGGAAVVPGQRRPLRELLDELLARSRDEVGGPRLTGEVHAARRPRPRSMPSPPSPPLRGGRGTR